MHFSWGDNNRDSVVGESKGVAVAVDEELIAIGGWRCLLGKFLSYCPATMLVSIASGSESARHIRPDQPSVVSHCDF